MSFVMCLVPDFSDIKSDGGVQPTQGTSFIFPSKNVRHRCISHPISRRVRLRLRGRTLEGAHPLLRRCPIWFDLQFTTLHLAPSEDLSCDLDDHRILWLRSPGTIRS